MKFTFPTELDAIDDVPETYQPLYSQTDDGKFALAEDVAELVTSASRLKGALENERKAHSSTKSRLKGFEEISKDPTEVKTLLEGFRSLAETPDALRELIEQSTKGSPDLDKRVQQTKDALERDFKKREEQWRLQIEERDRKLKTKDQVLASEMIDSTLRTAIASAKGSPKVLLPVMRDHVRVIENEDGIPERVVVDPSDGSPRYNAKGDPMTIAELVAEFRQDPDFAGVFEAEVRSGSGAQGSGQNGGSNRKATQRFTPEEWRNKVASEKDPKVRARMIADAAEGRIIVK